MIDLEKIFLKTLLSTVLAALTVCVGYGQVRGDSAEARQNRYQLGFDTLRMKDILLNEKDQPSIKFDYPPDVSFDTVQCELFYNGELIGVVPFQLRHTIPASRVHETKFEIEVLPDGRVLLHILKILTFR